MNIVSELLRELRNLGDISERIGVSIKTVNKWAAGNTLPSERNVDKLAEYWGIDRFCYSFK